MKNVAGFAFKAARIGFGILLALAGGVLTLLGALGVFAALWISIIGVRCDWEPWFLALVCVGEAVFGVSLILLTMLLFKDKRQQ